MFVSTRPDIWIFNNRLSPCGVHKINVSSVSFNNRITFIWRVFTWTGALCNFVITFLLKGDWPKTLTKRVSYLVIARSNLWTRQRFKSGWRFREFNSWLLRLRDCKRLFRIVISRSWAVLNFLWTPFPNGNKLHLVKCWGVAVSAWS